MSQNPRFAAQFQAEYEEVFAALSEQQKLCPFAYETEHRINRQAVLYPCSEEYVATCGCQKDGVPHRRPTWRRSA